MSDPADMDQAYREFWLSNKAAAYAYRDAVAKRSEECDRIADANSPSEFVHFPDMPECPMSISEEMAAAAECDCLDDLVSKYEGTSVSKCSQNAHEEL